MEYTIPAIPTKYRGRNYRSRLEARWAAFFDLLGWTVEYEPCDFNGWIPDFVIAGIHPIYCEVKPIMSFASDVAAKIDRAGCTDETLLVGTRLFGSEELGGTLAMGWLREGSDCWCPDDQRWGEAVFSHVEGRPGLSHAKYSFANRIEHGPSGDHGFHGVPQADILGYWTEAGNAAQWATKGHRR